MSGSSSVLAALVLIAAMALILKNFGFKGAPVFVCTACVFIISSYSDTFFAIQETYQSISDMSELGKYSSAAMKAVAIGYLAGICADICRELGESGVAKCVSVVSKLELFGIASPFILEMIEACAELFGG